MINFKLENGIFNFRVAGLLFNDDKILIHRLLQDNFYTFPGGRVEMFESTEETVIREMKEELGIDITVDRLLWICEQFYNFNCSKYHQISFFYLIECRDWSTLETKDVFYIKEGENNFEFKWIPINEIKNENIYPEFIKEKIENLPFTIERIVEVNE